MKITVCTIVGIIGTGIAGAFGGWNSAITTLLIFMAIDYISGLVVAGIFKKSTKTESGALNSNIGWKGLAKKGMTLLYVLMAARIDLIFGSTYIRNAVIIAFITNELISITENAGLMGIHIPPVIVSAIDVLQKRSNKKVEDKEEK